MARDNHPRFRQAQKLQRKKGTRPPHDRLLIVCEGSKTEPTYFDDIRKELRIPAAHIRVLPSDFGTQPRQVVDFAEAVFRETKEFDAVYAVFDRDEHDTYADALQQAARLNGTLKNDEKKKVSFHAVPTVPCFELWLLLHFEEVHAFGHRDEIIARVRQRIQGYEKGMTGVFERTQADIGIATERAAHLRERFEPYGGEDPFTSVDELVAKLLSMRRP